MAKIKFYSKQEISQLKKIANLPIEEKTNAIKEFSKANDRSYGGVYYKVLVLSGKQKRNVKTRKPKDASLITTPNSKKGEFVIPVKNWKLQHDNGNLNIVINF